MNSTSVETVEPIRLDLNTAPVLNEPALARALQITKLSELVKYPEQDAPLLTAQLEGILGVQSGSVLVGNGSDEILDLAARALVPGGGTIGVVTPSFSMYDHIAESNGLKIKKIPMGRELPVDSLVSLSADALFLASPNNPTGTIITQDSVNQLLSSTQIPILIDEAYAEFAHQDFRPIAAKSSCLIVTRTFSKAYGLPGIRVGYGVGSPSLLSKLRRIKMPYNVSGFSEQAALAALSDNTFVPRIVRMVESQRDRVLESLKSAGWPASPSHANFLLVGPLPDASRIQIVLRDHGILVKLVDYPGAGEGQSLRITIGTDAQNDLLLKALGRA
jgi:histidinol-phosphate aminotransferase